MKNRSKDIFSNFIHNFIKIDKTNEIYEFL